MSVTAGAGGPYHLTDVAVHGVVRDSNLRASHCERCSAWSGA